MEPKNNNKDNAPGFKKFAYYVAWLGFVGALALAVRDVIKDHEPPKKSDYVR